MGYKKSVKIIVLMLFFIPVLFWGCESNAVTKEVKAPDFALKDLDGNNVTLSQYSGNVVILDFWATWCPPCRMSIPEMVKLQEAYRDKGLVVLGISVDSSDTNDTDLSAFKAKYKMNYAILRVDEKTTTKYFGNSEFSIPTMFVINQNGMVVDMHSGYSPGVLEKFLKNNFKW
jgi:cytochrome c biogenesis protein CcmG, thiol:disulfide interchange protein DsbE